MIKAEIICSMATERYLSFIKVYLPRTSFITLLLLLVIFSKQKEATEPKNQIRVTTQLQTVTTKGRRYRKER